MDVFAHALWTNAVFYKKYRKEKLQRYIAVAFGVLPDLAVFTPAFLYGIYMVLTKGAREFGPAAFASNAWPFQFASIGYNYTHSLVIFAIVMVIVMVIRKGKTYWPMWGWVLHILIDIPSHKGFYETPFLFPLSSYKFDHGVSWAHPLFMLVNYSLLAIVYLVWFLVLRKNKSAEL